MRVHKMRWQRERVLSDTPPQVPFSLMGQLLIFALLAGLGWGLALNVTLQSPSSGSHVILKRAAFSGYVSGMGSGARAPLLIE